MKRINQKYPFSILRGATHLGMQRLLNPYERRKKPMDIMDLNAKVRCTCRESDIPFGKHISYAAVSRVLGGAR